MTQSVNNVKLQFEDKPTTPAFTFILIFALLGAFFFASTSRMDWWLSHHAFQEKMMVEYLKTKDYTNLFLVPTTATFASWTMVQMSLNIYFVWVFCKHIEQKLGPLRNILLLIIAIYLPWVMTYFNLYGKSEQYETYFVGPAMFMCTIIGCYLVFPPVPKSKIGAGNIRNRNEIFRRDQRADPLDKYIANPYMFLGVFAAFQLLLQLWITIGFPTIKFLEPMKGYSLIDIIPAFVSVIVGFGLGQLFLQSATASFKDGPLTMEALKRYHELVDLDVSHDDAIKGTARTLGLPVEKVREWVQKNKGKLRVK